jgi:hypothetical protein
MRDLKIVVVVDAQVAANLSKFAIVGMVGVNFAGIEGVNFASTDCMDLVIAKVECCY